MCLEKRFVSADCVKRAVSLTAEVTIFEGHTVPVVVGVSVVGVSVVSAVLSFNFTIQ